MKSKKAMFLDNLLSVIIALIGISLIVFAAVRLYKVSVNQEEENVKNILNVLEAKINNLKDSETGKFPIQGIEKWFLTGWSKSDPNRPNKCFFESCLCICKGSTSNLKDSCQEKGLCRDVKKENLKVIGEFIPAIEEVSLIVPAKQQEFISLPSNLVELEITKTTSEITIKKNE